MEVCNFQAQLTLNNSHFFLSRRLCRYVPTYVGMYTESPASLTRHWALLRQHQILWGERKNVRSKREYVLGFYIYWITSLLSHTHKYLSHLLSCMWCKVIQSIWTGNNWGRGSELYKRTPCTQTNRQTQRITEWQTDRLTDRQTERRRHFLACMLLALYLRTTHGT
jgi:hypothetical protein